MCKFFLSQLSVAFGCLLITSVLFPFEECLRPCLGKHEDCCYSAVDYVYLINLDERPEKYAFVKGELDHLHIRPYRFSAVNGWKLPNKMIMKMGVCLEQGLMEKPLQGSYYVEKKGGRLVRRDAQIRPKRAFLSHCMSPGAIGIVLSHLSVIKDAYLSGYNRIWIMEDDIEMKRGIDELTRLISEADRAEPYWDILYTDIDTISNAGKRVPCRGIARRPNIQIKKEKIAKKLQKVSVSDSLFKIGARYGSYSYILTRNGMKKILDYFSKYRVFLPLDMEFIYIEGLVQLSPKFDIVSTKINSPSDNGAPNYSKNEVG